MSCGGDISKEATEDPGIKLFGRKIPLPEDHVPVKSEVMDGRNGRAKAVEERSCAEKLGESQKSSALGDRDPQNPVQAEAPVSSAAKGGEAATNATEQEKVFKKPEKVLQCPRCNSLDTKFCYFNNYNVNQPRHFCKNCQRYWTAGGTMRNVPVGAGRRKNKHLASQYRHVIVSSDGVAITRSGATDLDNHRLLSCSESSTLRSSGGNGTLLTFGHEGPLCESMETVLSLRDQKRYVEMGSVSVEENEEPSCISSMTASGNQGNQLPENVVHRERVSLSGSYNDLHIPSPLQCYFVPPWGLPWKAGLHSDASVAKAENASECISIPNGSDPNPVRWFPTPMLAVPGFCPSSVPLQYSPASYWGCMPVWAPGAGGASVTGSSSCLSPSSPASKSCCSRNGSPTLGKHSRDVKPTDEYTSETCIWFPKTLRFVDPGEASESAVWATWGIQPGQKGSISRGSIFGTFESKAEDREHLDEASEILVANPAALSRSHTFQEST